MSDLSYLQDTTWLAEREDKWDKYSKRWLYDSPEEELAVRKAYFFDGNIKHLLTDSYDITLYHVINNSPLNDLNLLIQAISEYWFWVLESPSSRDNVEFIPDVNERFMGSMHAIFSRKDDHLAPEICINLFSWLYGNNYQGDRAVTLIHDGQETSIPVAIDVDALCFNLLSGIILALWRQDEGENISIFKALIPYFLSIYPYMSSICFESKLPDSDEFEGDDGQKYFEKYWIWNRWLLTTLNGFISEYEEEEDIEELVCNDEAALTQLREGLDALQMPEEFYRLQEFVQKHKGESLYASED